MTPDQINELLNFEPTLDFVQVGTEPSLRSILAQHYVDMFIKELTPNEAVEEAEKCVENYIKQLKDRMVR